MAIKIIEDPNPSDDFLDVPQWLKDHAKKEKPEPEIIVEKKKLSWMSSLPLSSRQEKKKRQQELMSFLSSLVDTGLKKKPLIVNNQLKSRVIEIDRTFKTKPIIVKGKLWRIYE
jgi:hypothetical protein